MRSLPKIIDYKSTIMAKAKKIKIIRYFYPIFIGLILFFLLLAMRDPLSAAGVSADAIALRVLPNPDHHSPLVWYKKNVKLQGSPQSLTVDGYEAVRDGRTVYVNAANIDLANNKFYTNIYIISHNQEAEISTIDIFGQLLIYWKFNTNLASVEKNKVRSDTKRLVDLNIIESALENYKNKHGNYPELNAGTYIANKTISVWPSWRETLSKELGISLPFDPINKLGACGINYNPDTCWDDKNKKFDGIISAGLPDGSKVFAYATDKNGGDYYLCANWESGFIIEPAPVSCAD